jgi:hypothetical protein
MRAHTIISIIVLGALAIPASASADPASSDYSRADAIAAGLEESSQATSAADYSSLNATTPPVSEPSSGSGYASLNATTPPVSEPGSGYTGSGYTSAPPGSPGGPLPEKPTFASSPVSGDQFDWGDAALGAGAALALAAFGGAALLSVRRRTTMSPARTS